MNGEEVMPGRRKNGRTCVMRRKKWGWRRRVLRAGVKLVNEEGIKGRRFKTGELRDWTEGINMLRRKRYE